LRSSWSPVQRYPLKSEKVLPRIKGREELPTGNAAVAQVAATLLTAATAVMRVIEAAAPPRYYSAIQMRFNLIRAGL